MSKETSAEAERQLRQLAAEILSRDAPDAVIVFTREEAEVLQKWAKIMLTLETLGRWGGSLRQIMLFFGGALVFYLAFRDAIEAWVRGLIS